MKLCIKLVTYQNYTKMHDQKNINIYIYKKNIKLITELGTVSQ
jgi:hypothetical protein